MNRQYYFNFVESQLSILAYRIEMRGKLNFLELNLHSENFYLYLFNALFDWTLENMNLVKPNSEAIDLIDKIKKNIIQVSATASKQKVESALSKDLSSYSGYGFKFILIAKDAADLRTQTFKNPHNLTFAPKSDIYDVPAILKAFNALDIDKQQTVYELVKRELSTEISPEKVESNLAAIIHIISKEDLNKDDSFDYQANAFDVEGKIDHNKLKGARTIIDDYKVHYGKVDKIYSEFDKQGVNKSISVLNSIRKDYIVHKSKLSDDDLFFKIFDCVIDRVKNSSNYASLPYEELEQCVNILVVDAFIRCKIFENPAELKHATT